MNDNEKVIAFINQKLEKDLCKQSEVLSFLAEGSSDNASSEIWLKDFLQQHRDTFVMDRVGFIERVGGRLAYIERGMREIVERLAVGWSALESGNRDEAVDQLVRAEESMGSYQHDLQDLLDRVFPDEE